MPTTSISIRGFVNRTFVEVLYPNAFRISDASCSKSFQERSADILPTSQPLRRHSVASIILSECENLTCPEELSPIPSPFKNSRMSLATVLLAIEETDWNSAIEVTEGRTAARARQSNSVLGTICNPHAPLLFKPQ